MLSESRFIINDEIVAKAAQHFREIHLAEKEQQQAGSDLPKETLVNVIYRLTENTRAQAKAVTTLYQQLKYTVDRGLQEEDLPIFEESIEQAQRLAVTVEEVVMGIDRDLFYPTEEMAEDVDTTGTTPTTNNNTPLPPFRVGLMALSFAFLLLALPL
ncbi:hypothetical protein G6F61_000221 [Rhizopus arrhizus]|nr:hypothetical protein G6F61_000221 [Rhizopus arrhizus]